MEGKGRKEREDLGHNDQLKVHEHKEAIPKTQ